MIELNNVSKTYGNKTVVKESNWVAKDGEITGLIGHSAAGKSTILKMATGVLSLTTGSIKINGKDIEKNEIEAKEQFGFVSDSPDHFLDLTGIEYLNFIADVFDVSKEKRKAFIDDVARRFNIYNSLNNPISSYSHGMRQKIMVMGALIHEPSVWILDEPFTGLDPQPAFELKKMMREHAKNGNSVLFSTPVLDVAEKLCDKVVIINRGSVLFEGTLDDLRAQFSKDMSLEEIFFKVIEIEMGGID